MREKKIISLLLAAILVSPITVNASVKMNNYQKMYMAVMLEDSSYIQEQTEQLINNAGIDTEIIKKYTNLYKTAKDSGYLSLDKNNHININEKIKNLTTHEMYLQFVKDMNYLNECVESGLIYFTEDYKISSNVDEILKDNTNTIKEIAYNENFEFEDESISTYHICSLNKCSLGGLVHRNYASIVAMFDSQLKYNPENAYTVTVGYWIGLVREGGAWDYKIQPGYKPWNKKLCCTYGKNNNKANAHLTSEYIGNYNYGYTGSYLFSLSVLKLGSSAVDFFKPTDKEDHPAITSGYNDAKDIE